MTQYIITGFGLDWKGRTVKQFVADTCKGGSTIVLDAAQAKRYTHSEALAIVQGRHAVGNFSIEPVEAYTEEEAAMWEADYNAYQQEQKDENPKWTSKPETPAAVPAIDLSEVVGTDAFPVKYECVLNEITRLHQAGERQAAKALLFKLREWLEAHNIASFPEVFGTPAKSGGSVVSISLPAAVAA